MPGGHAENHTLLDNGETVAEAIRGKYAISVSDGSFTSQTGTAAFILEGKNYAGRIIGVNMVPGYLEDQCSLRSKLA